MATAAVAAAAAMMFYTNNNRNNGSTSRRIALKTTVNSFSAANACMDGTQCPRKRGGIILYDDSVDVTLLTNEKFNTHLYLLRC